ncbi:single-stranded-DNA-specific exonuclease RecJ [Amphibacillus jilinensis]|uniref:single-stranded-DNA-specific exonuclease RecJ n=1 Tax=Amphibacillus jilinensis TaxID=1216008 RepID=UPI0002F721F1|nr:single-stranded-DNA-specific exonuclease RecJ [Amphibacillus jilinensis]
MLHSQKKWNFTYKQDQLLASNSSSTIVEQLLATRGMKDEKVIEQFLNPKLEDLLSPELLSGVEATKKRIGVAIDRGESILVFGDYDADGVTATTLLVETLHELGAMCDYYIPNRFTEGYGPNPAAFHEAKKQGFDLIITVDTGIAAFEAADVAKELGIDLIITDHHELQDQLPEAFAIVHPKCSDRYPFKELAGVGVAFKLAQALLGYFPEQFLDLVVIGTIADLVPLKGENRILAKFGLTAITRSKRPGIHALKEVAGIKGEVNEQDIGFGIGPRLNAVGRLQTAYPAVELLLTEDPLQAQQIASEIDLMNQERQQIVSQITEEAIEQVEQDIESNQHVIVVAKKGWNEGVLGIVASKLLRIYQRPVICLTLKSDLDHAKGSGRSIEAFDLFHYGMQVRDLLLQFGGHAQAAGMTLAIDQIDHLRDALNALAKENLKPEDYKEQVSIDASIDLANVSLAVIEEIEKLAPFGMANPRPLFHVKGKPKDIKQIGAKKNHLKLALKDNEHELAMVGFGLGELLYAVTTHTEAEIVGQLQMNEWNGMRSPQMLIEDIRIQEDQVFDFRGSKLWDKRVEHLTTNDSLCVTFQNIKNNSPLPLIQYDALSQANASRISNLVLVDLPIDLSELQHILSVIKPDNIYACYSIEEDHFLESLPSRADFKWFYGLLLKRELNNNVLEKKKIAQYKGWKLNKIEFILEVFSELEFVKITNGIVRPNQQAKKRQIDESVVYQKALKKREVQEALYYSNYQQLKSWLESQVERTRSTEEENVYGL